MRRLFRTSKSPPTEVSEPVPAPADGSVCSSEDLQPVSRPHEELAGLLGVLERGHSTSRKGSIGVKQQLEALSTARALVKHHIEDVLPHLRQLILGVVAAVEDQRVSIAKTAICLFKEVWEACGAMADADTEFMVPPLMRRSGGGPNALAGRDNGVAVEADAAIFAMIQNTSENRRIFRAGSSFMESTNRAIRTHGKLIIGKAFELLHDEEFYHLVNQQPGNEIQLRIWELADQLASKFGRPRPIGCVAQQQQPHAHQQGFSQQQPQQMSGNRSLGQRDRDGLRRSSSGLHAAALAPRQRQHGQINISREQSGDPRLTTYDARMDRFLKDAADPDVPLHDSPSSDSFEIQDPGPSTRRSQQRQQHRGRPAQSPLPRRDDTRAYRGETQVGRRDSSQSPLPRPDAEHSNNGNQHGCLVTEPGLRPLPKQHVDEVEPSRQERSRSRRTHAAKPDPRRPSLSPLPRRQNASPEINVSQPELDHHEARDAQGSQNKETGWSGQGGSILNAQRDASQGERAVAWQGVGDALKGWEFPHQEHDPESGALAEDGTLALGPQCGHRSFFSRPPLSRCHRPTNQAAGYCGPAHTQKHVLSRRQMLEAGTKYTSDSSLMTTEPDPGTLARLVHSSSPTGSQPGRSGRLIGGHVHERENHGHEANTSSDGEQAALFAIAPLNVSLVATAG
ncbi:hypothetical protein WJX74_006222 [Apatococcus lobatus]|uniref:CLASP N-terminal domain-containing protein n=1 Tax=Apatococcus lobatus TaxID=904363 RepID=A0AAW1SB86_9CHLO